MHSTRSVIITCQLLDNNHYSWISKKEVIYLMATVFALSPCHLLFISSNLLLSMRASSVFCRYPWLFSRVLTSLCPELESPHCSSRLASISLDNSWNHGTHSGKRRRRQSIISRTIEQSFAIIMPNQSSFAEHIYNTGKYKTIIISCSKLYSPLIHAGRQKKHKQVH